MIQNSQEVLVKAVNLYLEESARNAAKNTAEGWFYLNPTNPNEVLSAAFVGTIVNPKDIKETIRNLAKTVFGYVPGRKKDLSESQVKANKAALESAGNVVKSTEVIREGLKAKALESAVDADEGDEGDEEE